MIYYQYTQLLEEAYFFLKHIFDWMCVSAPVTRRLLQA